MSPPSNPFAVAALYQFARVDDVESLRRQLAELCCAERLSGTLLVAEEGLNGTVAGTESGIERLVSHLRSLPGFAEIDVKFSSASEQPFRRMKVKIKREIVTMGVDGVDAAHEAGTHVEARDWNVLIADPDTVVIDTRNRYETAIGTFTGAIDPKTDSFSEFPRWADEHRAALAGRRVAMFCTGGIRCEKATAYMRSIGIDDVYHLKGGILKYLEDVPADESLWNGECFVFDERVSVTHGLSEGRAVLCRACRRPLMPGDMDDARFVEGVSCRQCAEERSDRDRLRYAERQRQVRISDERGASPHLARQTAT